MDEFKEVKVFLPIELIEALQNDPKLEEMVQLTEFVKAELPEYIPTPKLEVGMKYRYPNGRGNSYEIVQLGKEQAVIRRLNWNRAGPEGSTLTARIKKIQDDLLSGEAFVLRRHVAVDPGAPNGIFTSYV